MADRSLSGATRSGAVGIVVLAAGAGRRFGGAKQLAPLDGRPLLVAALTSALSAAETLGGPVWCVLGAHHDQVSTVVPDQVDVLVNDRWQDGISSSLRTALSAARPVAELSAVCIGLGDQPRVGPQAYLRLAEAHRTGAEFAVATHEGVRSNPVLLGRTMWDAADTLRGDRGASQLMDRHPVVHVACDGTGDPIDVDDEESLRALQARSAG